jgi:hypothetical protein
LDRNGRAAAAAVWDDPPPTMTINIIAIDTRSVHHQPLSLLE